MSLSSARINHMQVYEMGVVKQRSGMYLQSLTKNIVNSLRFENSLEVISKPMVICPESILPIKQYKIRNGLGVIYKLNKI